MEKVTLLSKFKGSVFAALSGDCIGAIYESGWAPVLLSVLQSLDQQLKTAGKDKKEYYYTDDTEMAHVLAHSLVNDKGFDAKNVARRFAERYFETCRGEMAAIRWYGGSVSVVFDKILKPEYSNEPYKAASEQFSGSGSYGNGSGMRVFPVALYYHKNQEEIERVAAGSAKVTHAHEDAINGAIMQAMAVEFALSSDETTTWKDFTNFLKGIAHRLEAKREDGNKPYTSKLNTISSYLTCSQRATIMEISNGIGTGIKATEAVCAAIFAFLYCLADRQPEKLIQYNKVQQVIFYSISLGGDTDTIATMAGAIAGAFYGHSLVPDYWLDHFEGKKVAEDLALQLYDSFSRRESLTTVL